MKKLLIMFFIFISISFNTGLYAASGDCTYDVDNANAEEVGAALDTCLNGSNLVTANNVKVNGGFGIQIKQWTNNISLYLGILAVGSIVFGALMMTLSAGEEEKINKAKDIIKWGIIGFLGLLLASAIINLVVKIMYSI